MSLPIFRAQSVKPGRPNDGRSDFRYQRGEPDTRRKRRAHAPCTLEEQGAGKPCFSNCNGQSLDSPDNGNVDKMSENAEKMSKNCPEGFKTQFSDIFGNSCLFGRCFCLVTLSYARPLQFSNIGDGPNTVSGSTVRLPHARTLRPEPNFGFAARIPEDLTQTFWVLKTFAALSNQWECYLGDGPNTVSGSTVSNTELSEFLGPHRVPGGELSELLSAYYLCAKANSPRFSQNSPSLPQNSVSSLY